MVRPRTATTDASGNKLAELRYMPFGETRYTCSQPQAGHPHQLPPEHASCSATGQREEAGLGLYFYNARWYDPALARFIQADSIVPGAGNPMAYDRYAYVMGNPEFAT